MRGAKAAEKAQYITEQRLKEGVDSQLELTKSQLVAARIRLRIAEAEGQQDVLREHLSKLIGLPADEIQVVPESIPQLPLISQDDDYSARAVANSPVVQLAEQKARWMPVPRGSTGNSSLRRPRQPVCLSGKVQQLRSVLLKYTANNLGVGLNLKFPSFNYVQKAKAKQADADAIIAHKQADLTKNQVAENALKLQRSIRQLEAARDVAKLDWQVSQGEAGRDWGSVQTGAANLAISRTPNSRPTTSTQPISIANLNLLGPSSSCCALPVSWRIGPFPPLKSQFADRLDVT